MAYIGVLISSPCSILRFLFSLISSFRALLSKFCRLARLAHRESHLLSIRPGGIQHTPILTGPYSVSYAADQLPLLLQLFLRYCPFFFGDGSVSVARGSISEVSLAADGHSNGSRTGQQWANWVPQYGQIPS